jgi:hypothetical protein
MIVSLIYQCALSDKNERIERIMMRNTVRGILALVLTAAATWLANRIVEQVFGPEDALDTNS